MTKIYRRYRYRLYPNALARAWLNQAMGNSKAMYNTLLYQTKSEYELYKANPEINEKPGVSHFDLAMRIKDIRNNPETPWFLNTPFNCYKPVANHLSLSFKAFFDSLKKGKDVDYPAYKRKTSGGSVHFRNEKSKIVDIDDRHYLKLEGLWHPRQKSDPMIPNLIRIKYNRPLPSEAKSLTIKRTSSGKYYVSFLVEEEVVLDPSRMKTLGIDLGLKTYIASYDGQATTKIDPLKAFRKSEARLAKNQARYSRKYEANKCKKTGKVTHTKNMAKISKQIANDHEHIANQRDYFIKYTISQLMRDVKSVVIEDLHTKGMMSNHCLAKSVSDAAFGKFKANLLSYCEKHEVEVLLADRYFPSTQLCNSCGNRNDIKVGRGITEWTCQHCGAVHDRDANAAMNLYDLAFVPNGTSYVKNLTLQLAAMKQDSAIAHSLSKNQGNNIHEKRKSETFTV